MKKVVLGCDHAGAALGTLLADKLAEKGYDVENLGGDGTTPVDYPHQAELVSRRVLEPSQSGALGVLVCGTGVGMAIAANKIHGIRAAVVSDTFSARMSRAHNNGNILCIGARVLGQGLALDLVETFLETAFEGERHASRLALISELEKKN